MLNSAYSYRNYEQFFAGPSEIPATHKSILVRGIGCIASAIAHRLHRAGHTVLVHDDRRPCTLRWHMSFAEALVSGSTLLAGTRAVLIKDLDSVSEVAKSGCLPITDLPFYQILEHLQPDVLIDARVDKRNSRQIQRDMADLTFGVGPGFTAGKHVDIVCESSWGETMGRLIDKGHAVPPNDRPERIKGMGWQRFAFTNVAGVFSKACNIGDRVQAGQTLGFIDNSTSVRSPISGTLRGLVRDGDQVVDQEKIAEVDPRIAGAQWSGLGHRPRVIAQSIESALCKTF